MTTTRGQHLIGKALGSCVLERLLGYGGSSAVFFAQQHDPDRKVAIKVFLPRFNMDKQMQRDFYVRFLREAEAASHLDHPNILPIYSYGEQDGLPYIIMPYMAGGTLSEYIAKNGPLSLPEAQWYLEQIASALDYAHEQGCVHCDVKPANLLLDEEGNVFLSDFGIAHMVQHEDLGGQPMIKAPEALMGTPDYISPEQALGQPLDGRSDIYSLGITLFFLLAKQLPFKADNTLALALMHIHEKPPSLTLLRLDISPTIDRIIGKALAKEPDARFQTVGDFSAAFSHAVEMSELVNAATDSGKRSLVTISDGSLISTQSEPQPLFLMSQPVVQIKPVSGRSLRLPRLLGIGALLLIMVAVTIFATTRLHSSGAPPLNQNALSTGANAAPLDLLSDHGNWPGSSTFFYSAGQYHIKNTSVENVALAPYLYHQYSNFHLSVTMQEISSPDDGADYYGIVFRSFPDQSHYYLFEVVTSKSTQFVFWRYDGGQWKSIAAGPAPALVENPGKNTLTVEAHGNAFSFSINGKPVAAKTIVDSAKPIISSGAVGLYVEDKGAEVVYSHLYIDNVK